MFSKERISRIAGTLIVIAIFVILVISFTGGEGQQNTAASKTGTEAVTENETMVHDAEMHGSDGKITVPAEEVPDEEVSGEENPGEEVPDEETEGTN